MLRVKRPRRLRPEDVEVVTVSASDVEKMLAGTEGWQEFLCLSVLAYTGIRRDSACRLRWKDVDLIDGTIAVREKGGRHAVKPVSWELVKIFQAAVESAKRRASRWTT